MLRAILLGFAYPSTSNLTIEIEFSSAYLKHFFGMCAMWIQTPRLAMVHRLHVFKIRTNTASKRIKTNGHTKYHRLGSSDSLSNQQCASAGAVSKNSPHLKFKKQMGESCVVLPFTVLSCSVVFLGVKSYAVLWR